jgi:GNAT superfamily N-acetyltransferase
MTEDFSVREAIPGTDDQAVTRLIVDYLTWAHPKLRDEYGIDDPPTSPDQVAASLGGYRRPNGLLLLANDQAGTPLGVGALRRHDRAVAEVKRMYVRPEARSHHLGSLILDRLIDDARAMGAQTLRLDTVRFMTDAQRLYRSRGFIERPPYDETEIPERIRQFWLFFQRDL